MKKENLLFLHHFLKAIADSIIKIFIPLYILKQSNNLNYAIEYLIIYTIFVLLLMYIFKNFLKKYGVISILISYIPIIIGQGILSFCKLDFYIIVIVAILMAICQAFYSIPLNILYTFGDKKANVGKFQIGSNLGKILFTLISGFLLSSQIKNSFLILAISSTIFYLGSIIPLFICYSELKNDYQSNDYKKEVHFKVDKYFIIFQISYGIFQPVMDHLIPLYLYLVNMSFKAVTLVIVIIEIGKLLMNYLAQFLVNHKLQKISVILSTFLFSFAIIALIFIKVPLICYILSTIASLSFPLTFVPMFRITCRYFKQNDYIFKGMLNRDLEIFSGRSFLYAFSLTSLSIFGSLIFGLMSIPFMLYSEIKIIDKYKDL